MSDPSNRQIFETLPDSLNPDAQKTLRDEKPPAYVNRRSRQTPLAPQASMSARPEEYTRTGMKRQGSFSDPAPNPRTRKPATPAIPSLQERLAQVREVIRPQSGLKTASGGEYYLRKQNASSKSASTNSTSSRRPSITDIDLTYDNRPLAANVTTDAVIAVNRFCLGALPDELREASVDPKQWLKNQLQQSASRFTNDLTTTRDSLFLHPGFNDTFGNSLTVDRHNAAISKMDVLRQKSPTPGIPHIDDYMELIDWPQGRLWFHEIRLRDYLAITSRTPFLERLTRFWGNHFSIQATGDTVSLAGAFERDVCRRHLTGKFSEMLIAATLHPGMLLYLDNESSIGKDAPWGDGINTANENLARELMELHSLGVDGGYTQNDVAEMADALSGHSIGTPWDVPYGIEPARYVFKPHFHQPGSRLILTKTYAEENDNPNQMIHILNDLARHPSTVDHICRKLAKHFLADTPPEAVVQSMKTAWESNDGQLLAVYHALIDHPLSWDTNRNKLKAPADFFITAGRTLGPDLVYDSGDANAGYYLYTLWEDMGQFPLFAPSPEGWSDDGEDWAKPAAMMTRMQWADQIAGRVPGLNPLTFLQETMGDLVSPTTTTEVTNAADTQQGMTLALMSPEFQRR